MRGVSAAGPTEQRWHWREASGAGGWVCSEEKAVSMFCWDRVPSADTTCSPVFSLPRHSVTCSHGVGEAFRGNFLQFDNQRTLGWCSVVAQRIYFALSALVYTGSRDIKYKFASGFVPLRLENWHFCWHSFLTTPKSLWNIPTRKSTAFGEITSSTSKSVNDSSVWQGLWHFTTVALPAEVF